MKGMRGCINGRLEGIEWKLMLEKGESKKNYGGANC